MGSEMCIRDRNHAEERVQAFPNTYALHSALLSDVTGLMLQQARAGVDRAADQLKEALAANPDRGDEEVGKLALALSGALILDPQSHGAPFSGADALAAELPVELVDPTTSEWQNIWRLWTKYFALGVGARSVRVYEGRLASQIAVVPFPVGTA